MNLIKSLTAFAAVAVTASGAVFAQECQKCPHASASGKTCAACPTSTVAAEQDQECAGCPVEAAMAKLPKMTFKVGDQSACCENSAAALAKKHEAPVHFVVAEKTFEDKQKAYVALVETTEKFVTDFTTPQTCEKSGTHTVAGHSCACPVTSGAVAKKVEAAIKKVSMTYAVGDHSCGCPNEAAGLAKKEGKEVVFVVGDQKTSCEMTARLNLAHAKYKAAVQAVAATTAKEKKGDS